MKTAIIKRALFLGMCITFLAAGTAESAVTVTYGPFDVTFYDDGDSSATGYTSSKDWTVQERADFAASIGVWDSSISDVQGRQINLDAIWYEFGGGILGASYSPTNGDGSIGWTYPEHVWRDGVDYSGPWTGFDNYIALDVTAAGYDWNFGSGAPSGSEIDFRSVVTHELGHALGFYDTYDSNPAFDDWGNGWGTAAGPYVWAGHTGLTAWDRNLVDDSGNRPEVNSKGTPKNFDQTDDPVFWDGAFAVGYYGDIVPIYAPKPFESGSSLSHLDQSTFPLALMSPFISLGVMGREPTELEWQMMADMGWSVAVIPAPGALLLLCIGVLPVIRFYKKNG